MRTNNRLLLSLLVPLTIAGQSTVSVAEEQPYSTTFQITGKEGGGYSISAIVKPASPQAMPLSVIQNPERKPAGETAKQPGEDAAGKNLVKEDPNQKPEEKTAQQPGQNNAPVTKQELEDVAKKMAEQMQKQQEELAKQMQKQQEELAKQLQEQQRQANQQLAQQQQQANQQLANQQRQANQQLANQQQQIANQMAQQQQQTANQMQQGLNQLAQQQQALAQAAIQAQQRQQRQLGRLFAQARRDQMMRNFEQAMFGNPNLMNQMGMNTAQGIMGLVSQMMQAASQMAGQMRGGQGQGQDGQQNQQTAQGPTAQEIAAELQKLMGDKLSTDAAEKVLTALKQTAQAPSPQALNDQMQEFTDLGKRLQEAPQSESPSRVSSAADDLSVGPNDYEGLAKLADKLARGDNRMTKQFLEMSLDAAGRVSSGNSYTSAEKQKAREFALKLVSRFKDLKEQVGSSSASERSMRSALEFDIDKCMRINNETA
ncbi:MAG: hypothetical protein K2Y22_11015 [Candidatus Obscuribacterales bacterium]|nr:hypothetical protein [Candidatus Obscuribacterales bacterium]